MKIIKVDRPYQYEQTTEKQCIDGEYPNWCVKTEVTRPGETFTQWWNRKQKYIEEEGMDVDGIYWYDVETVPQVGAPIGILSIRYDYIKR